MREPKEKELEEKDGRIDGMEQELDRLRKELEDTPLSSVQCSVTLKAW
jgi:hypothetical protein